MTDIRLAQVTASGPSVDALIVGVTFAARSETKLEIAESTGLKPAERRRILEALARLGATGKAEEVVKLPGIDGIAAPLVVAVGVGASAAAATREQLRRAAGAATVALRDASRVALMMPATNAAATAAVAQGALLGSYRFESYRGTGTPKRTTSFKSVTVVTPDVRDRQTRLAVREAEIVAREVLRARDLVNTPASALRPKDLAAAAAKAVSGLDIKIKVLTETDLAAQGYGGILAVGQGSASPPRLIRLSYTPPRPKIHIALVGKGITFDSGGLSIKTAAGMETMKCDMGGAAAVIAATTAIAQLGVPAMVTAYAACAENMPSGTAQRPGDVLTTYSGKTIEVKNTDAEGRLVLADALGRAAQDEPDVIIDVATLTGAQIVALGSRVGAVMGNDDRLRESVTRAAQTCGEQFWPMPLPGELRASLDSTIADLSNIGERMGGMLTAGVFLQEFIPDGTRWAHLDIAGPAFNEGKPHGYTPAGGTGMAVRTLVQVVRDLADSKPK